MIKRIVSIVPFLFFGCRVDSTFVHHNVRTGTNGVLFLDIANQSEEELCFFHSDRNYIKVYDVKKKEVMISSEIEDSFGIHTHVKSGDRLTFSLGIITKGEGRFKNGGSLELNLPVYKCHDFENQNHEDLFVQEPFSSEHVSILIPDDSLKLEIINITHSW